MQTPTAAWLTAAQRSATLARTSAAYEPIWLIEIVGCERYFATANVRFGGARTIGDGWLIGGGLLIGAQIPAYGYELADGGIGDITHELRDTGSTVEVGRVNLRFLNHEGLAATFAGLALDNMPVALRLGFEGIGRADYLPLWAGVIDRIEETRETWSLELLDGTLQRHRDLSVRIGAQHFPEAPSASRNKSIPILIGSVVDAPAIPIAGDASGSLAFAMQTSSTEIYLPEFGAGFPSSGQVLIDSETITYTRRRIVQFAGRSYLRLSGLGRGAPVTHAAGAGVNLTSVQYAWLLSYALSTLLRVRSNGAPVSPGSYTVDLNAAGADKAVSIIRSSTNLPNVTFDGDSGGFVHKSLLTNGGFETGDLTGWTTEAGATTSVGTSAPVAALETYRASVQGLANTPLGIYQEVPTRPGERYRFYCLTRDDDVNLVVTNGGFETGDLTGWTLGNIFRAQFEVTTQASTPDVLTFLPVGGIGDGDYSLVISPQAGRAAESYYFELYQDVTVTPTQTYTFSMAYVSFLFSFSGFPGTTLGGGQTRAGFKIGSVGDPGKYAAGNFLPYSYVLADGRKIGGTDSGVGRGQFTFTPTEATVRITLLAQAQNSFAATVLDAVRVQLANTLDTSAATIRVGSADGALLYLNQLITTQYQWHISTAEFIAATPSTRVTLRSQYHQTPKASFFDGATLFPIFSETGRTGGENPIDAVLYVLHTFLPHIPVDLDSFRAAQAVRDQWIFRVYLANPGSSRALLESLADQCECVYRENERGEASLVALDDRRAVVAAFDASNMAEESFSVLDEPIDNLATHIYVWYGARSPSSGQSAPEDFSASVYATPTETSDQSGPFLSLQCATALAITKRERRLDYFATAIADVSTATLKLRLLVNRKTMRHKLYTFQTFLDAAPLQIGDVIELSDPRQAEPQPQEAEVLSRTVSPQTQRVTIQARGLGPAEWAAEFEYDQASIEADGWDAEFEYTETVSEQPGWDAEFEPDDLLVARGRRRLAVYPEDDEL